MKIKIPIDKMTKKTIRSVLREITSRISRGFNPERIILFGSYATGSYDADSDLDILVVMPVKESKRKTAVEIGKTLHDIRIPKDIIVTTPEDYAWRKDVAGTIEYPASRSGSVLYER